LADSVIDHAHANCGNCGSALTGPYCAQCGQHAHESARSIKALFHDAWHLATHVDDRFWKTMVTLLLKPGVLTKEYFAEHRARYLPPVRVYLVLSVLFFAFGSTSPKSIGHLKGMRAVPVMPGDAKDAEAASAAKPSVSVTTSADDEEKDDDSKDGDVPNLWAKIFNRKNCAEVHSDIKWLEKPLQESCFRNADSGGEALKNGFIHNIPKMMFAFVPLMALTMMLLYWWPRHYYVEHLVLFLHNHAAVFLILLVETLLGSLAAWLGWKKVGNWVVGLTSLYTVWYVYRAMRVYYGQGKLLTTFKLGVVGFGYFVGFSVTLLFTLIFSIIFS
jgi:Protein of unknown function (DUF3667)